MDVALVGASVLENQAAGTSVGVFSTGDPDAGDSFSYNYSFVAGAGSADNASFTISGNRLKTSAAFDFETKSSYSIRVRTTDSGARSFEKRSRSASATDVGGSFGYSLVAGAGLEDKGAFTVSGTRLKTNEIVNMATVSEVSRAGRAPTVLRAVDRHRIARALARGHTPARVGRRARFGWCPVPATPRAARRIG